MVRVFSLAGPPFAVAATFTCEPIESAIRFWRSEIGQPGPVEFAQYNQVFQALLEPAGLMSRKNFANAVLIRLEDWIEGEKVSLAPELCRARLKPLTEELVAAARAMPRPAPMLVVVCPPSSKVAGDAGVVAVLDELTAELVAACKSVPGVYAFGPDAVSANYPVGDYYDSAADAIGKIPYTTKYFAALGTFLTRAALAVRRSPFKVIVMDCDNTLWSGVCGEGGVAAVTVGPGFRAMQQFVATQAAEGKVLCLASKNVESDVWDIFEHHPDMVLKREQIVGHRINWTAKSQNLRELAKELNLGLDSFIFMDDNPVECAEVRANCPEVLTLQAPARGEDWPKFLQHVWAFDQLTVTDQDRQRAASYIQNVQREAIRKESAGLDDFLAKLELRVEIAPPTTEKMARVAQLTERTNQFNFSTIRRTEPEIVQLLKDSRCRCDTVEVKDRFGDYGLVGVVITRAEPHALVVDTMLLSCRVLGRGVEHQMLASIGNRARSAGLVAVEITFVRSKKNQPALDFLNAVGIDYRADTADGFVYRIPTDVAAAIKAKTISSPPPENEKETGRSVADAPIAPVPYQRIATEFHDVDAILAAVDAMPAVLAETDSPDSFIEPRNDREKQLVKIWSSVLKLPRISIRDDYFAIGGTSLLAVRLVLEIEKVFGRQLPIATLLKAPTIEKLANFLSDPVDADDLAVVTLRAEGSGPPLLLLAGVGGHVLSYRRLVQLLKTDQPVYGLEMREEFAGNRVPRSLETIAAETVERILKIQPDGPYLLAGWSFGGMLGFEIAQQLRARNKTVNLVALFDTWGHDYPRVVPWGERIGQHAMRFRHRGLFENARYLAVTGRGQARLAWHHILKLIGARKSDFHQYESPLIQEMVAVFTKAVNEYRPKHLSGRLVMIRATRRPDLIGLDYSDPKNGWGDLADAVDVYPVDADHLGLFEEPAVEASAAALTRCLHAAGVR